MRYGQDRRYRFLARMQSFGAGGTGCMRSVQMNLHEPRWNTRGGGNRDHLCHKYIQKSSSIAMKASRPAFPVRPFSKANGVNLQAIRKVKAF